MPKKPSVKEISASNGPIVNAPEVYLEQREKRFRRRQALSYALDAQSVNKKTDVLKTAEDFYHFLIS